MTFLSSTRCLIRSKSGRSPDPHRVLRHQPRRLEESCRRLCERHAVPAVMAPVWSTKWEKVCRPSASGNESGASVRRATGRLARPRNSRWFQSPRPSSCRTAWTSKLALAWAYRRSRPTARFTPVDHIVEVAFDANVQLLALGGSMAAYAAGNAWPAIPFWKLLFKNARILLLGSDDFPMEQKLEASREVSDMLIQGWCGVRIQQRFPLADIAAAHEHAESSNRGRVVLSV